MTHLALEASSHGLEQHRLDGLKMHVAAFTNLSRDHLDHHPDMEAYFAAKARLFTELLLPGGSAVINIDDPFGARLAATLRDTDPCRHVVLTIGGTTPRTSGLPGSCRPISGSMSPSGDDEDYRIPMALAGSFQAMNALTAAVMAHASGLAIHDCSGRFPM